jgi:GNAT superfamily N-acetyltransferase
LGNQIKNKNNQIVLTLTRTDSDNSDFIQLVRLLDADLATRDGNEHSFYAQFNKIDKIRHVVVAFENNLPVGCGAIKSYDLQTMEVKRMYTLPEHRGKGIAKNILKELEKWAAELSCNKCILETGRRQPEAIELYQRSGYTIIPNYGQYAAIENSVCFEKQLTKLRPD